ncbi:MAG: hypothetical protein L3K15_05780 [Thermoplasmata archaeon]|nr:hypothetical protein [Thermoplasmata archaeon]
MKLSVARPGGASVPTTALERHMDADREQLAAGRRVAYVTEIDAAAVSAGISVDLAASPALRRANELGVRVVRRTTGGSVVLVRPGDLLWSIVEPLHARESRRSLLHAYERLGSGAVTWLRNLGLESRWSEPFAASDEFCLLGARGSVLTASGRALGGAAQHSTARAMLHHGLIVRSIDRRLLARLFDLTPELLARTTTSLEEMGVAERARANDLESAIATSLAPR